MKSKRVFDYVTSLAHNYGTKTAVLLSDVLFACNLCEEETEDRVRKELLAWRRPEDSLPEKGVVVDICYNRCGKVCHAYGYRPTRGDDDFWHMDWVSGDAGRIPADQIIGWRSVVEG